MGRPHWRLVFREREWAVWLALGCLLAWSVRSAPLAAQTALAAPLGDAAAGRVKSEANRCQECHGAEGMSDDLRIPNHAGQIAGYLVKQLHDFQSGRRHHQVMDIMAADLDESDIADIAAYFASRRWVAQQEANTGEIGRKLFSSGDGGRNLPPCRECHGAAAEGRVADGVYYPKLSGQRRVYLHGQLTNWKLGERKNSPEDVMNKIAQLLTDDEINALAVYLSGL